MIRRTEKEDFLQALETWMNEVVAKNANGHNELIPGMVRDGFQASMTASANYHVQLARMQKIGDKSLAKYHYLMADIYKTFMSA